MRLQLDFGLSGLLGTGARVILPSGVFLSTKKETGKWQKCFAIICGRKKKELQNSFKPCFNYCNVFTTDVMQTRVRTFDGSVQIFFMKSWKRSSIQKVGRILVHYLLRPTNEDLKMLRCRGNCAVVAFVIARLNCICFAETFYISVKGVKDIWFQTRTLQSAIIPNVCRAPVVVRLQR